MISGGGIDILFSGLHEPGVPVGWSNDGVDQRMVSQKVRSSWGGSLREAERTSKTGNSSSFITKVE
jgi:hypothetical protein